MRGGVQRNQPGTSGACNPVRPAQQTIGMPKRIEMRIKMPHPEWAAGFATGVLLALRAQQEVMGGDHRWVRKGKSSMYELRKVKAKHSKS